MEKFYELLKEYIAEQGVPIYQIAKETGINRTLIQNVISGKRSFQKDDLTLCSIQLTLPQSKSKTFVRHFSKKNMMKKSRHFLIIATIV